MSGPDIQAIIDKYGAPVAEGELGSMKELYSLAETLTPQRTRPEVDARVKEVGFATALKQLITRHKMEHGSACSHINPVKAA